MSETTSNLTNYIPPLSETIESFYTQLFKIDFSHPISSFLTSSICPAPVDPFAPNTALLCLYDLFLHTAHVSFSPSPRLTIIHSSTPSQNTTSYDNEFLSMIGNPTQFADHLRSTFLLFNATKYLDLYGLRTIPTETGQILLKTCATILSCLLQHFNIICKHYDIAACGSFNFAELLHHFLNQIPNSTIDNSIISNSIFSSSKSQIALSCFNNQEQIFLSTTLPTAFRASLMHSTALGGVRFPLSIPFNQADTFTEHYTQLLGSSPPMSVAQTKVPTTHIPFSIFAYLGLLNAVMRDIWSIVSLSSNVKDGLNLHDVMQLFLSSPTLPDDIWSRIFLHLAQFRLNSIIVFFENMNLIQIMNLKLHSIIRFPICTANLSNILLTDSSQTVFNAMFHTMSSILTHPNFQSSNFYTNPTLHLQCSQFALQIIYIYLLIQWALPNEMKRSLPNEMKLSLHHHTINFSFEDCLKLFKHVFHFQKHKLTLISHPSHVSSVTQSETEADPPSLSPHIFCIIASLMISFDYNPHPLLFCLSQLLRKDLNFVANLYSHPQFTRFASFVPPYSYRSSQSNRSANFTASMFCSRLISTAFLQFVNLNQALKYYSQQIYQRTNDMVFSFRDIICTKIPTYTTSSVIIEAALETESSMLRIYNPSFHQSTLDHLKDSFDDHFPTTLNSISSQVLFNNNFTFTPTDHIRVGLQEWHKKKAEGEGNSISPSHADIFVLPSTLLIMNPIINVIPYMAIHHNFNKTLYHSIVCHPWSDNNNTSSNSSLSFRSFSWILGYLELYHTFLCKPIRIATIETIVATTGPILQTKFGFCDQPDLEDISERVSQSLDNTDTIHNNTGDNIYSHCSFLCARINNEHFNLKNLSKHSQFCFNLHKHAHLPANIVLPLYYSYTEALLSVIMGFSYTQFHLHHNNNPIKQICDQSTNQLCGQININNDRYICPTYIDSTSTLSHGTIFQTSEEYKRRSRDSSYEEYELDYQDNDEDDAAAEEEEVHDKNILNNKNVDSYSQHMLNLYNYPDQLSHMYVPKNRKLTRIVVETRQATLELSHQRKEQKQIPLTLEWSSAMVQHSVELFIDLLLNESSYQFISQINFSDGNNPLAKQSNQTLNYFDNHITEALSEVIIDHNGDFLSEMCTNSNHFSPLSPLHSQTSSLSPMGNLPYFYNLTEKQQIALYKTYSYNALFSASYGPFDDVPLIQASTKDTPGFSQEDLSHVLIDVNTTFPTLLNQSLTRLSDQIVSKSTPDTQSLSSELELTPVNNGFRFHSL